MEKFKKEAFVFPISFANSCLCTAAHYTKIKKKKNDMYKYKKIQKKTNKCTAFQMEKIK